MIGSLALILCVPVVTVAYTREYRTITFDLPSCQHPLADADPALYGFVDSVIISCGKNIAKIEIDEFRNDFNKLLDDSIFEAFVAYTSADDTTWIQNCDEETVDVVHKQTLVKQNWRRIFNETGGPVTSVKLQEVLSGVLNFENSTTFSLGNAATTLSLMRCFDIATMVYYPYILYLLNVKWEADMDSIIYALNVMAEGHLQTGQSSLSVLYFLKLLMLLDTNAPPLRAVNALRLLLLHPPLPAPHAEAVLQRAAIVEDLVLFTTHVRERRLTVTLQVLMLCITSTPFFAAHLGLNDLDLQTAMSDAFTQLCPELTYTASRLTVGGHSQRIIGSGGSPVGQELFRVGFLSCHLLEHSIGKILLETITSLEQVGRDIAVTVFLTTADITNQKPVAVRDSITTAFERVLGERFVRLPGDIATVRQIVGGRHHSLDALIYTDVGMEFSSYVLAHSRLAPIQIAWWGHPVTTGSLAIDYFFGLEVEPKDAARSQYAEQLVRMNYVSSSPGLYHKKLTELRNISSIEYGIPAGAKHVMVLGQLFKVHPVFDRTMFRILSSNSDDTYIVLVREKNRALNSGLYARWSAIQEEMCCRASPGQDEALFPSCCTHLSLYSRLYHRRHQEMIGKKYSPLAAGDGRSQEEEDALYSLFLQHISHYKCPYVLHRIRLIHLVSYDKALLAARAILDTFPYGGCLTAHDAMANAVPIVTLSSQYSRGLCAHGLYRQMNHTSLLTDDVAAYEALVTRFLTDDEFRQTQSEMVDEKFRTALNKNIMAAEEWANFLRVAIKSQQ